MKYIIISRKEKKSQISGDKLVSIKNSYKKGDKKFL